MNLCYLLLIDKNEFSKQIVHCSYVEEITIPMVEAVAMASVGVELSVIPNYKRFKNTHKRDYFGRMIYREI
jgi:hypothetical protein